MAWPTGARWGRGQTGPERQKVQTKLQRKLPIRADAAGLLQLHPRAPFRSVRLLVEPQLKEWKWNPDLAAHVLKTLAMHSQARTATQTLQVMRCNEVTPLAAHYNAALAACRKLRRSQMAELLLKFMRQDQVLPNDDTVGEALRCGSWEWALQLWQTLRDPKLTVASHNHAMAVLQPEPNLALQVFEELKTWQLAPDADSFVQGITAVGALGDWQRSLDLLQSMRRRDLGVGPEQYAAVLRSLGRNSQWQRSVQIWDAMEVAPDGRCYGAMAGSLAGGGGWLQALDLLEEMVAQDLDPKRFLYSLMCEIVEKVRSGEVQEGESVDAGEKKETRSSARVCARGCY